MVKFNEELLEKQEVTDEQEAELEHIYALLENTVNVAKILQEDKHLTFTTGSVISNTIRDIEFMLQKNWNFEEDEDTHSYQLKLPGCTCAKLDNQERWGTPYKVITISCPYHGQEVQDET